MMKNSGIVLSIFLMMASGHQHFPPLPPPHHHQQPYQQQQHYHQQHHNNNYYNNNNDNNNYNNYNNNNNNNNNNVNNNNNINTIHQVSPAQYAEQQWPYVKSNFSQYNIQVQSPTNINTSCVTRAKLTPVTIHLLRNITGECVSIENTGYYLEMRLIPGLRTIPYVTGGPLLRERYLFEQMHFHWGPNDRCGSEHRVDGKCFSMEVHIVLYNEKYGSNSEATRYPDGLTVISFFGEVAPQDNPNFKDLVNKMSLITEPESNTTGSFQKEFNFLNILFHATTYYTYPGSLTTPPYNECVTWIMYPQTPFPISSKQINAFRRLRNSEGRMMTRGNDRPLQSFGNRPMRQPLANGELEVVDRFNGAGMQTQNGQSGRSQNG